LQELINLIKINIIKSIIFCLLFTTSLQQSTAALNEKIIAAIGGEGIITSKDLHDSTSLHIILSNAEKEINNQNLRIQIRKNILRGLVDENLILYYVKKNPNNGFSENTLSYYRQNYVKTIEQQLGIKNTDFYTYCKKFKISKDVIKNKINAMIIMDLLSKGLQKKRNEENSTEKVEEFLKERKMKKNKQNIQYAKTEISYQPTKSEIEYAKNNIQKYHNKNDKEIQNDIINKEINRAKTDLLIHIRRLYHVDTYENFG